MKSVLKRLAARLPDTWQQEIKRHYFARQMRRGRFVTNEREYGMLSQFVAEGDWVLDIGANIGHYTARLSELVGASGRVIAFEPVPETVALLAANIGRLARRNVTLLNVAVSDTTRVQGMNIPRFATGLDNYYMAALTDASSTLNVLCLAVDALGIGTPIRLAKIDAEGHEVGVLRGMEDILRRDHPILIVEDNSAEITEFLESFGYRSERLAGSSNRIFQ